ncbi:MAG TPA: XisH family protein [Blastocatellia bacterium]|nr:XisH family protein [Blastocatellia bacterium]HMV87292.1 XisH family protein [Blastocatellia bacterium]HMY75002.1 XisH family protein [Blastocatellia bacterium]HMZ22079.1 XisH family protein [Blastocatellia bacterium]HNG32417.1 XisH family protein [Blastocatellia bacterium]
MSKRDKIHDAVRNALVNDGWTITADPFEIEYGATVLRADLAADRMLAAERAEEKIVVEIKSFLSLSLVHELQAAVGQYQMYLMCLEAFAPERQLYLALSEAVWEKLSELKIAQDFLNRFPLRLVIVNLSTEEIRLWKK